MKLCRSMTLLFAVLDTVIAFAQSPVVRAHIEPSNGILVGQPVRLVVSVYVPNYFTGSPEFPEFEMENAIVVLPQDRPENSNTQIGSTTYAGITEIYIIYPQQAGDFHLPPAQIVVPYAVAPPKSIQAKVPLPTLSFHANVPAAAEGLDYFLPTTSLTIQQRWSRPPEHLRVGDSIERTITITATKMQAMLIPPLSLNAPEGIRVYPEEPIVQEHKTYRGDFVYGRRTETAKYFLKQEGDYTLQPIELQWWNLSTHRLVTVSIPAVHLTVAANPNYVAELPPEAAPIVAAKPVSKSKLYRRAVLIAMPSCIAAMFFLWAIWHFLPRALHKFAICRKQQRFSESAIFRKLLDACKRNHDWESYTLLLEWLRIAYPGWTIDRVLQQEDNAALSSEIDSLGAAVFAKTGNANWTGSRLAALLKQQRKATGDQPSRQTHRLPKLNPQ